MKHITKLCADSLRTLAESNYGIKLKASHAHELVAAFFGYKSRAALLADTLHPLSNLRHTSIVMLFPTAPIERRRKNLEDLPQNLPDNYTLGEWVYTPLVTEKLIVNKIWSHYEQLATFLADEYLRQNQMDNVYRNPVAHGVKQEIVGDDMRLTVVRFYQVPTERIGTVYEANIITTILLKRVAGHIGYDDSDTSVRIERLNN